MATYVNNLRLKEIATGAESGTWGTSTNTNLELIADAFGSGTEAITTNADTHTTTIADGSADEGRAIYMKYTGTLDSACTITLAPNTINKFWIIENATSGSQNIIISQGSGANITIGNGNVSAIFTDGAGGGAAVLDALADLELSAKLTVAGNVDFNGDLDVDGTTNLDAVDIDGAVQVDSTITVGVDDTGYDVKFFGDTASAYMLWDTSADDLVLAGAAGIDLAGDIDVDGTANLDIVDIDGAVDMASTLTVASTAQFNSTLKLGGSNSLNSSANRLQFTTAGAVSRGQIQHSRSATGDIVILSSDSAGITLIPSSGTATIDGALSVANISSSGNFATTDTGPHSFGGAVSGVSRMQLGGAYTSDGSSSILMGLNMGGALTGASGDTTFLLGQYYANSIVTQTATEDIAVIAQAYFVEPAITDNLTGDITTAATVYIASAPTEGESNWALYSGGKAAVIGSLLVSKDGGAVDDNGFYAARIRSQFSSDGSSNKACGLFMDGTITGAAGDTTSLAALEINSDITTQTATESIGVIASLYVDEPAITDNLTGDITVASTVYIASAPSEGEDNAALWIASGSMVTAGHIIAGPNAVTGAGYNNASYPLTVAYSGASHQGAGWYDNTTDGSSRYAVYFNRYPSSSWTTVGSISTGDSSTAFNTSSDYRLKENETPFGDALDLLGQLKPYKFNFKIHDASQITHGFFAHEAAEIVPQAVTGEKDAVDDDDKMIPQSIDHSHMVPLLVAAIQELTAKVEALESA